MAWLPTSHLRQRFLQDFAGYFFCYYCIFSGLNSFNSKQVFLSGLCKQQNAQTLQPNHTKITVPHIEMSLVIFGLPQ